ncbi:MAG TPA: peptidyl-prolyl cis-trans isomerase [Vicinamibacterales bacterium]|nr:peptidyl-prolyl cis-trans isomerase [Vicinamibacterales bacterium]
MFDVPRRKAKLAAVVAVLQVLGTMGLVAAVADRTLHAEIIEQILVKVNGDIFTKTDLEQRQVMTLRQKGQQIDLKSDPNNEQLRKALDEITPQIMVDAVDEMLIVQRGKELGYRLTDEQFKKVVDDIRKENKIETDEQFQSALKSEGMTMTDLRRNVERSMLVQRVQQNEVLGKIAVTQDEARKYYQSHLNDFTTTPSVTLREILISVKPDTKGLNVAADEAAQKKADQIRARVAGGESFDKVASDESDAPSKANAGLIGPINMNDLSADLRKLIDPMKPGAISEVLRTRTGYQILKLETKTTAETMTFDQAREQISERVAGDKRKAEFQKYLDKLRGQAIIEWKNPDVKRAFDEGLKQQASAPATQ